MMGHAKPMGSLSSGLLARPGQAKPAMRPQGFHHTASDDLGWNDMGHGDPAPAVVAAAPPVLIERAKLASVVAPRAAPTSASTPAPRPQIIGHRAAFTVRLDPDRHLRLRLASAVAGRSSQRLVVAAIDAFLDSQPQVEELARQLPASPSHRSSGETSS